MAFSPVNVSGGTQFDSDSNATRKQYETKRILIDGTTGLDFVTDLGNAASSVLTVHADGSLSGGTTSSGTNTGDVTLTAVGSTPSANGASLSGQVLTLQPADATHPGVVTTAAQTMAGAKTFSGAVYHVTGTPFTMSTLPGGEVALNSGVSDAPGLHFYTANNTCMGIDATNASGLRFVKNLDESGGAVLATLSDTGAFSSVSLSAPNLSVTDANVTSNMSANNYYTYSAATLTLRGAIADGGSAVGLVLNNNTALTTTGAKIASFRNADVEKLYVDKEGKLGFLSTDNSGSPGNTTIDKASGRAAIASGASTVTVTNALVSATSIVKLQLETVSAGVGGLVCVPGSGSFVVTSVNGTGVATATSANCKFSFVVCN